MGVLPLGMRVMVMRPLNIRKICVKDAMKNRCMVVIGRNVGMPDPRMNVDKRKAKPQGQPQKNKETHHVVWIVVSAHGVQKWPGNSPIIRLFVGP